MKRNGKYICNRCGCKIDTANDLDCMEVKAFQLKSITEREPSVEVRSLVDDDGRNKFFRVSDATKYHYCVSVWISLCSMYIHTNLKSRLLQKRS